MNRLHRALALSSLLGGVVAQEKVAEPELDPKLTDANLAVWREHIRARPTERAWAELPWLMTFHDGLAAAKKTNQPLLLWTMNGHPFGCT